MIEGLFDEKLAWFKQHENPEAVLVIADNHELIRIVVAWPNLKIKPAGKLIRLTGDSDNEIWDWLWRNTRFSLAELKEKIGVAYSESILKQRMKPLIGSRVLYPDGTVNSFVQRYLREQVVKLFGVKHGKITKAAGS